MVEVIQNIVAQVQLHWADIIGIYLGLVGVASIIVTPEGIEERSNFVTARASFKYVISQHL